MPSGNSITSVAALALIAAVARHGKSVDALCQLGALELRRRALIEASRSARFARHALMDTR